jgi:hypothetical protein
VMGHQPRACTTASQPSEHRSASGTVRAPQKTAVCAWLFDHPEALPTLAEATRGSAVVQAMRFDGADSCPGRSAAAVALVPAEQQCDETLRGGRTQLDVDGAVSGHRL